MKWKDLPLSERASYIEVGVRNGLSSMKEIRDAYNEFDTGGYKEETPYSAEHLMDAIYENSTDKSLGEPSHHYDFTQSEEWADAHGYHPDARGHRDDRVKKETHPTHPSRGTWKSPYQFELSDKGMSDSNYTLFGLADGGQDPQATMTYQGGIVLPEITSTPRGNYIYNPYDNINIYKKAYGGNFFDEGSYLKIAKDFIKENEGFFKKSYADAPKGKTWRSIGYGFNDSGFYSKYPMGISTYYDKRGGITREEAEKELEWVLRNNESQLAKTLGNSWASLNDYQKAALMDVMYQRPASVLDNVQLLRSIRAGKPNWNLLGVTGYEKRNSKRRKLASGIGYTLMDDGKVGKEITLSDDDTNSSSPTFLPAYTPMPADAVMPQFPTIQELYTNAQSKASDAKEDGLSQDSLGFKMLMADTPVKYQTYTPRRITPLNLDLNFNPYKI